MLTLRTFFLMLWLILILLINPPAGSSQVQALPVQERLSLLVGERVCKEPAIRLQGVTIACSQVLSQFYQKRCFMPAWTDPEAVAELVRVVRASGEDGLPSEDYHLAALEIFSHQTEATTPEFEAERDLIMTDAIFRLSQNLLYGKVDPKTLFPDWNLRRTGAKINLAQAIQRAIDNKQIPALIDELRPKNPYYLQLKQTLVNYRNLAAQGGWPRIPRGPVIKKGKNDRRLPLIRRRLAVTDDLDTSLAENGSLKYDEKTYQAIRRFQSRHGLPANGLIDPPTLQALNTPVEQRIDQILVNLERARWSFRHQPGPSQVVVDIASFTLSYAGPADHWATEVVVGQSYTKTPLLDSKIEKVIFNPTWTVPVSIGEAEMLPKMKKDPSYLEKHHYRLISRQPLQIVQEPGPWNALGRVKFTFPNDFDVYLHDTPSKQLFKKTTRTFSHGCIRVKDPLKLAVLLLNDPNWDRKRIDKVIKSENTTPVDLKEPVPIAIVYRTVDLLPDGGLVFRTDVYERDFAVLGALQRSPSLP